LRVTRKYFSILWRLIHIIPLIKILSAFVRPRSKVLICSWTYLLSQDFEIRFGFGSDWNFDWSRNFGNFGFRFKCEPKPDHTIYFFMALLEVISLIKKIFFPIYSWPLGMVRLQMVQKMYLKTNKNKNVFST